MARIRIYEWQASRGADQAARFHIFGLLDVPLSMLENGVLLVWAGDVEDIVKASSGWHLVYEGDAS